MQISNEQCYDPSVVAILPMGFCYPGKGTPGDLPPRPECGPLWHDRLLDQLPNLELIMLAGLCAHAAYLGKTRKKTLREPVRSFETYLPRHFALPHPSWRSRLFMSKNSWFEADVLPALRSRVTGALTPESD
ncbi:MAG: uracil-DNA glycosylase [Myxococcota bacterium]|jgi:uracil-DNA glycosylase